MDDTPGRVCRHGYEWCGHCYRERRGKALAVRPYVVPLALWCPLEDEAMAMSRSKSTISASGRVVVDQVLEREFPTLHEFMTESTWDDGKIRKTGSLMIVVEDGWWKCWLHDRDGRTSAWFTGTSVKDVMMMAEEGLLGSSVAWRKDTR